MNVLVTAGPTREYIDPVRFITNGSSGKMGYAVASAALAAGHEVTLLTGPVALCPPAGATVVSFVTVAQLKALLEERFDACDALIMTAAVGDFTVSAPSPVKLHRAGGAMKIELVPTDDILAGLARRRRVGQVLIGFAVEDIDPQTAAGAKLAAKNLDYVVVNMPAAMGADESEAAILSPKGIVFQWGQRTKEALASRIVSLLTS
ncbi:MAG: phosphopantothenoylcysteine decarboxylase [Planctomycetes bacterium]|nr:phosphopantothenoylcysteine decarboxylase [Planctomycetota bacterium]